MCGDAIPVVKKMTKMHPPYHPPLYLLAQRDRRSVFNMSTLSYSLILFVWSHSWLWNIISLCCVLIMWFCDYLQFFHRLIHLSVLSWINNILRSINYEYLVLYYIVEYVLHGVVLLSILLWIYNHMGYNMTPTFSKNYQKRKAVVRILKLYGLNVVWNCPASFPREGYHHPWTGVLFLLLLHPLQAQQKQWPWLAEHWVQEWVKKLLKLTT